MNGDSIFEKAQIEAANAVMEKLRRAFLPELLGLISTKGYAISIINADTGIDSDSIASLAASSFGATRQLAQFMDASEFTVMSQEGSDLNVHIIQVSEEVLLVICFSRKEDIGKIRLVCRKAAGALNTIMTGEGN